ncbi:related to C6 transcription factor [Cephalotrichum gorgonifer]|uniref:Related to C6 transcription factor n=1 Tax=Cephalotrichum gorgonifer TaxID=2041049 RepID=A0AAE8N456_9PEZI|nr:related to C6 transcription factor [Cephalotrichum gorgonifer]
MQDSGEEPTPPAPLVRAKGAPPRVSLACVPCRSRHIKCDATRPNCRRCLSEGKECYYEKSRRGGLDRAALAARRNRVSGLSGSSAPTGSPGSRQEPAAAEELPRPGGDVWQLSPPGNENSRSAVGGSTTSSFGGSPLYKLPISVHTGSPSPGTPNDPLIELYYEYFHAFHPCVLPRKYLNALLRDPSKQVVLAPLISVLRFIGSIYGRSDQSLQLQLKEHAIRMTSDAPSDPLARAFLAQARLLLSIALYWFSDREGSRGTMDSAIRTAFELGMFRQEFAAANGGGDPVMEESWRRTWWQIFAVDAYYAAIKRTPRFLAQDVEPNVELPCEEWEYESGVIPTPKTLQDFESREFYPDEKYSSFAYLVGAVWCMASATAVAHKDTTSLEISVKVAEEVDAIVDGWDLLLPESKRQVMGKDGVVDELMFQAQMGISASIVGLHRPYSNLLFNPLELISSCPTGPPDSVLVGDLVNVHTERCLKAIQVQIRLMTLPARPFRHTPFVICMMTVGTIPHLAACKYIFTREQVEIARHQIRLSIGCMKTMAEAWPQAALNIRELQMIAQEVLGLSSRGRGPASTTSGGNGTNGHISSGSSTTIENFEISADGGFDFDTTEDGGGLQNPWDPESTQTDLTCYGLTSAGRFL